MKSKYALAGFAFLAMSCGGGPSGSEDPMYMQIQDKLSGESFIQSFAPADNTDDMNPTNVTSFRSDIPRYFKTNVLVDNLNKKFSYTLVWQSMPKSRADSIMNAFESVNIDACVIDDAQNKTAQQIKEEVVQYYLNR